MNVLIETCSGLERRVKITIPATYFEEKVLQKLKQLGKKVSLPGFRAGKVPVSALRKRYGDSVRFEVSQEIMNESFVEVVKKESIQYVGNPRPEILSMNLGEDFQFAVNYDLEPTVDLVDLSTLTIEKNKILLNEDTVDTVIQNLREQKKDWVTVREDTIATDDKVVIDYDGLIDGESFFNSSGRNFVCHVGSGTMLPEFEDAILGSLVGESKEIECKFPDTYEDSAVAGKVAIFQVKVLSAQRSQLPELTSDFFKVCGIEVEAIEAFREEILSRLTTECEQLEKQLVKRKVIDICLEKHDFSLPNSFVIDEIEQIRLQDFQNSRRDIDIKTEEGKLVYENFKSEHNDDQYRSEAEKRVKLGILFSNLLKENEIKVDGDAVRSYIESIAAPYPDPSVVVNYYYENEQLLRNAESIVLEEQLITFIVDQATVQEIELPYDQLSTLDALQ